MLKPRVAILGHVSIDQNVTEHAQYTNWGSTALYIADYYQRNLGITPDIITTYGPDFLPYSQAFRLHPLEPSAPSTALNKNHTREGKRIFHCHNAGVSTPPVLTSQAISLIGQADILIIATLLPNYTVEYVRDVISHAPPRCLLVLTAQGYLRDVDERGLVHPRDFVEATTLLPLFDIVTLSDDDHPNALEITQDWKKTSPHTNIIVTEGPMGASVIEKDRSYNVPTVPVPPADILDSVGCGDVFSGALAYHYYATRRLRSSIRDAHLAARSKLLETPSTPHA